MSYAEAAAKGPKQDPEDARAPEPPQVERTELDAASLIDVDSPHVSSIRSEYDSRSSEMAEQSERLGEDTKAKARELGERASDQAKDAKMKAKALGERSKSGAQEKGRKLDANKENPVVIANGAILLVGTAAVGLGAYKKYTEGALDWKFAGITVSAIGAFAVADYFASQWLFKNKFPPKGP